MGSNSEGPFAGYSSCHFIPRFQPAIPQVVDRLRPRRQSRASVPQQRSNTKGRKSKNDRTFQYEPLDPAKREIRLFELWPGKPGSKVVGHLFNVSLDESPSFEALSYTWGPPQPTYNISINGHRAFPVRRNLRKALDDLRQPDKPRVLWTDAIYINQPNNTEKAHQIKLMRSIYSCAQVVCAWLDHSVQPMDAKTLHVSVRKSSLMTMIRPTGIQLPMFFEIRTGKGCGPSRSSSWPKKSTYITSGMSLMGSSKVRVDYAAPVIEIYLQVFSLFIDRHKSIDFLCFSDRGPYYAASRGDDFPTWMPHQLVRWSRVNASRACGSITARNASIDLKSRVLFVQGLLVDTIGFIGPMEDFYELPILEWY
ncbi:heterokaryon incompatibility protein-domain-containing protein [Aspergillus caelatus]|uniref:Heterokaryon incompatibility protein-domain-containing protein n=1 Tax=Aspergillus caelatus TaxID=61420 RepID=A0A5N7AHS9_9EURO|nr:heterokaryon incompatibility protein-domain-containing protein [Aspergillus caelatus]KAE8368758.1 heterokaryon incompatibility protein-domain-containing protein [Aspergillus caelatus]